MILNRIWIFMFFSAFIIGLFKWIAWGDLYIFSDLVGATFDAAKLGFEICLYLTGVICLWMGIMKIGENGGAVEKLTRVVSPLFRQLFPEVPENHKSIGSMMMNFSANMLGLDNAATPLGLKAMNELQELNSDKKTATNAQIMFLVLNTSGLTIIPVTIFAYRAGSESPTIVFLPILISTYFATLGGLIFVAIKQKINLLNRTILLYLGTLTSVIVGLLLLVIYNPESAPQISMIVGNLLIFAVIITFVFLGFRKKINVYEAFVDGAKDGFKVAISIVPYLIAILIAIAVFRTCGALDLLLDGIKFIVLQAGVTAAEWIDALPVAFMKPLSGGGARAAYLEIMNTHGIDSFTEKIAATFQGSTETTFYVLAVYFGSVKVKRTRYALSAGLFADFIGIVAAILVSYLFYTHG